MTDRSFNADYYNWENNSILIIDDDYVDYLYVNDFLKSTKINLVRAKSKKEALNKIKVLNTFDLILLNVNIVDNDKCKIISEIKSIKPYIPIIAIVDKDDIDNIAYCIKTGCETYLHKPFDMFQFLTTINDLLEKGRILKVLYNK